MDSVGFPWSFRGFSTDFLWSFRGFSVVFLWIFYGFSVLIPLIFRGFSVDNPGFSRLHYSNFQLILMHYLVFCCVQFLGLGGVLMPI